MGESLRRLQLGWSRVRATLAWRLARPLAFAQAWLRVRWRRDVTYVGITGSAGKTTTKDLARAVLSTLGPCHGTDVTYNDAVGVARTLAGTTRAHRYAVVEVAGGEPGDMDVPLKLFRPDIAVLTLVEREHVKSADALDAVAREKRRLVRALGPRGVAVLNIDDPRVREIGLALDRRVVWFGREEGADVRLVEARSRWPEPLTLVVEVGGERLELVTRLYGDYLALPVLAALGVALAAGVPPRAAAAALAAVEPPEGRMQPVESGGVTFLRDDWKAPLWSFEAPLRFLAEARAPRKVAVIGTVSDMPSSYGPLIRKITGAAQAAADLVVLVGPTAPRYARGADSKRGPVHAFPDARSASAWLQGELRPGDLVLLKGSNKADHLQRILLARDGKVACWRDRCGRSSFCTRCRLLGVAEPGPARLRDLDLSHPLPGLPLGETRVVAVGLGNPGVRFRNTRHNVGQMALERLAAQAPGDWLGLPEGELLKADALVPGLLLFRPSVDINDSGAALAVLLRRLGLGWRDCLVLHDEFDLPQGQVQLRETTADSGHQGLRSIITRSGGWDVPHLRIGVRREQESNAARERVHEAFDAGDLGRLAPAFEKTRALVVGHAAGRARARPESEAREAAA